MNIVIVVAPHFVAGLLVDDHDRVMQAAPILAYMRGWEGDRVRAYVKGKGWRASRVVRATGGTVGDAVAMAAIEEPSMSTPNPNPGQNPGQNPNEPFNQPVPGAPHTPQSPRQNPEPDDADEEDDNTDGRRQKR